MTFRSILFDRPEAENAGAPREPPDYFGDLHLDQIVATITAGRDEYDLEPFFYAPLRHLETLRYRQDVMRDLESPALLACIHEFARGMRAMRAHGAQAEKLHYPRQRQRCFLDAVEVYCDAVGALAQDLAGSAVQSRGFLDLRAFLQGYISSPEFQSLVSETQKLKSALNAIQYCVHIDGARITVTPYSGERDYGEEVLQTFAKFKQAEAQKHEFHLRSAPEMNHIEAAVLNLVAQLNAEVFADLEQYGARHRDYLDATVGRFDREVQFYLACLDHMARIRRAGLSFCYPEVSDRSKEVAGDEAFDLALANKLIGEGARVVTNDFYLERRQRIFIVTGANQGGKTTFARTFGQLHHLASLGCPVPGRRARLFLFDRLFTHFEREEDLGNLSGKLENDLARIHAILERATSSSILIMNESLGSTTLRDALSLSTKVLHQIIGRDMLCVYVTFLEELASLGEATVSMVSTVDPENPTRRTFKLVRKPPDGLAHAVALAHKYGLTYERIRERLTS